MLFGNASGAITIQGGQALNTARNISRALTDLGRVKPNVSMKSTINDMRQTANAARTAGSQTQGLGRHIRALAGTRVAGVISPVEQEARAADAAVEDLNQSIDDMALGLLLAGGVSASLGKPLMAATIGSIQNAANLEQSIQNINAALGGLDSSVLEELSNHMVQVGIDSEYSAVEVAAVGEALAKAGYDTEQIMGGMTEAVIHLASATGEGLEPASRGIIQALAIWAPGMVDAEIAMTDAARAADILTVAANESSADVGEIIQGMRSLGPVAGQLGIGFDEAAAAIAVFTNYGMKGADAGLSLARGLENLSDPTSEASARMEELGIAAFDAQGDFVGFPSLFRQLSTSMKDMDDQTKLATLSMIFGQEAADVMALAIAAGADPLEAMIELMGETGIAAEQSALRMDTLKGAWSQFTEGIQSASGAMFRSALEPLKNLFTLLSDLLTQVALLPQPILTAMGAFMALTAALLMVNAAVLIGRGVWARWGDDLLKGERVAKTMGRSVGGLGSALGALWRSFSVGVFSLIPSLTSVLVFFTGLTAVILGVGAAIGAFKADFLGIRTAFEGVENFINNFKEGWNTLRDTLTSTRETVNEVKETIETATDPIQHAKNVLDGLTGSIESANEAATTITTSIGRVSLFFMALAYAIRLINGGDIPEWAESVADAFEDIAPIAQQVVDILSAAADVDLDNLENIKEAITELPGPMQSLIRGLAGIITSFSSLGRTLMRGGISSMLTLLPYELNLLGRSFGDVFRGIGDVLTWASGRFENFSSIIDPIADIFYNLGDAAQSLFEGLSWMMLGDFETATDGFGNALDSLADAFKNIDEVMGVVSVWFEDLGEQFPALSRITDELASVFDNLGKMFNSIGDALENIASGNYSQVFSDLGDAVGSLLSAGIDYAQALFWGLVEAIEALDWTSIIQGIRDFGDSLGEVPYVGWILETVLSGVASAIEWVRSAIIFAKDHWDDMQEAFDALASIAETLWGALSDVADELDKLPQPLKDIAKAGRDAYVAMLLLQGMMLVGGMRRGGGMLGGLLGGLMSIALFPIRLLTAPLRGLLRGLGVLASPIAAVVRHLGGLSGILSFLLNPLRLFGLLIGAAGAAVAFILSPMGLLVTGLTALAGGLAYAYTTSEDFRDAVDGMVDSVVDFAGGALDWVIDAGDRFGEAFRFARETGADPFSAALIGLVGIFPSLGGFITDILFGVNDLKTAWDLFVAGDYDGALASLGDAAMHVWDAISGIDWSGLWNTVVAWFQDVDWAGLWDGIRSGFWTAFNGIDWNAIGNTIISAYNAIPWDSVWEGLKASARRLWDWFTGLDWDGLVDGLRDLGGPVEGLADAIELVQGAWDSLVWIVEAGKGTWEWIKEHFPILEGIMDNLEGAVRDLVIQLALLALAGAAIGLAFGGVKGAAIGALLPLTLLSGGFKLIKTVLSRFPKIPDAIKNLGKHLPAGLVTRLPLIGLGLLTINAAMDGWKDYEGPAGALHDLWDDMGSIISDIRNGDPIDWSVLLNDQTANPLIEGIINDFNRLKNVVLDATIAFGNFIGLNASHAEGPTNPETGMTEGGTQHTQNAISMKFDVLVEAGDIKGITDLINDIAYEVEREGGTQLKIAGIGEFESAEEAYQATLTVLPNLDRDQWNAAMPDEWDVELKPTIDAGAIKSAFDNAITGVGDSVSKGLNAAFNAAFGDGAPSTGEPSGFVGPDRGTLAGIELYNALLGGVSSKSQQAAIPQKQYQDMLAKIAQQQTLANREIGSTPYAAAANGWKGIAAPLPSVVSGVNSVGTAFTRTAGTAIGQSAAMNTGVVAAQAGMATNVVGNVGRMAGGVIGGFTNMNTTGVGQTAALSSGAMGSSSTMAGGVIGSVLSMAAGAIGGFGQMQSTGTSEASRLDSNASSSAKGMGSSVGSSITSMAAGAVSRFGVMQSTGTSESSRMKGNVQSNSNTMAGAVGIAMGNLVRNVQTGMQTATTAISTHAAAWSQIINGHAGSAAAAAYNLGMAIGAGVANGMRAMLGQVQAAAAAIANAAAAAISAAAEVGSPSKVTTRIGKWIALGLPKGMTARDSMRDVSRGAEKVVGHLVDAMAVKQMPTWDAMLYGRSGSASGLFPASARGVSRSGLMQRQYQTIPEQEPRRHEGTYAGSDAAYSQPSTTTNITNIYALRSDELATLIERSERGANHAEAWEQPQSLSQYVRVARS